MTEQPERTELEAARVSFKATRLALVITGLIVALFAWWAYHDSVGAWVSRQGSPDPTSDFFRREFACPGAIPTLWGSDPKYVAGPAEDVDFWSDEAEAELQQAKSYCHPHAVRAARGLGVAAALPFAIFAWQAVRMNGVNKRYQQAMRAQPPSP